MPSMRIYLQILLFIILTFCGCNTNDENKSTCQTFRTGIFSHHDYEYNETYQIDRSDSLQTETNLKTKTTQISKIVWQSDCEYLLYKVKSDNLIRWLIRSGVINRYGY